MKSVERSASQIIACARCYPSYRVDRIIPGRRAARSPPFSRSRLPRRSGASGYEQRLHTDRLADQREPPTAPRLPPRRTHQRVVALRRHLDRRSRMQTITSESTRCRRSRDHTAAAQAVAARRAAAPRRTREAPGSRHAAMRRPRAPDRIRSATTRPLSIASAKNSLDAGSPPDHFARRSRDGALSASTRACSERSSSRCGRGEYHGAPCSVTFGAALDAARSADRTSRRLSQSSRSARSISAPDPARFTCRPTLAGPQRIASGATAARRDALRADAIRAALLAQRHATFSIVTRRAARRP